MLGARAHGWPTPNLPISVAHPALRDLPDARPQFGPRFLMALVAIGSANQVQNPTGMPFAGPVMVAEIIDQWPAPRRLYHFFLSTS